MGTLTASLGQEQFTDRLDIRAAVRRDELVDRLVKRWPALDEEEGREELKQTLESISAGEVRRVEGIGEGEEDGVNARDSKALLNSMPADARRAAEELLLDPWLLERLAEDIGQLGVAGEVVLSRLTYLLGVSRLLPVPLAAIVQGPSSSGKSFVIEMVATLFPDEAMIRVTQITPQALSHMPPGSLEHRFVVAGERSQRLDEDAAEATRALREMLSSGKLSKLIPIRREDGYQTVLVEQKGPIAYIESTTKARIFSEDANRCLMVQTDERPEQTQAIIRKAAAKFSGQEGRDISQIILKHHALQRMLDRFDVVVPFADRLTKWFPDDRIESRRAYNQLLHAIQAVALLHQRQRQMDALGRLIATAEDYKAVRRLLAGPLSCALRMKRLPDPVERFLHRLRVRVGDSDFTTNEACKDETVSDRCVRGWLSVLVDAEFGELVKARKGQLPAVWRLTESARNYTVGNAASLPSVTELFGDMGMATSENAQPVMKPEIVAVDAPPSDNFPATGGSLSEFAALPTEGQASKEDAACRNVGERVFGDPEAKGTIYGGAVGADECRLPDGLPDEDAVEYDQHWISPEDFEYLTGQRRPIRAGDQARQLHW